MSISQKDTQNTLSLLVHVYSAMTILFYIVGPFLIEIPLLGALGGHANYYAFIAALSMSGTAWNVLRYFVFWGMLTVEIIYPVLFLVFYLLSIRKKQYIPFGSLAISNLIIIVCSYLIINIAGGDGFELTAFFVCDFLGNICYCSLYFWLVRNLHRCASPSEYDGNDIC